LLATITSEEMTAGEEEEEEEGGYTHGQNSIATHIIRATPPAASLGLDHQKTSATHTPVVGTPPR
jgi:hypothetical protein